MDMQLFEQPSAEYRIHPFWFWNGEMEDEQIRRQIDEMEEKGVGGFFLCARQGMTIPYLSQDWFDKVRMAIEYAEKKDMHVWLYDEYPYPSGIAGGEVILEHPESRHVTLEHRTVRTHGGEKLEIELPWGRILYAKAAPVKADGRVAWEDAVDVRKYIGNLQADPLFQKTGLTAYTQKRFFTYRTVFRMQWEVPEGDWEVIVFQEKEIEDFKYYGTFVDPFNRDAMETFIRLTHDRYVPEVGEHFGKTVKGMFTDEIGLLGRIPWSKHIAEEFQKRCGYDLLEHLPALIDGTAADAAKVRYDYYQTIHLLLREVYHLKVHDWCVKYGLDYVAEVPAVRMTTQKYSHVPGGDSAHEKLGRSLDWILRHYIGYLRANPKMVSSLARQLGRTRNLIECFHSVGWSMTLQDARWMIDRMAALGTNFYNFHAFYYTMDALAKHDAPPSQFLQNPYWEHFRTLGDYTGRISYLMTEGKADIRIAFVDPTTTFWTLMANPFQKFQFAGDNEGEKQRLERLKGDWAELGIRMLRSRFDYDHLDPELLGEAVVDRGVIRIGHAEYSVVVLPPMTNLEAAAWRTLKAFQSSGGTVIGLGLLPHDVIEEGSPSEADAMRMFGVESSPLAGYWGLEELTMAASRNGSAHFLPFAAEEGVDGLWPRLSQLLEEAEPRGVRFELTDDPESFLMQTRLLSNTESAVFVSNQEGGAHEGKLVIAPHRLFRSASQAVPTGLTVSELELETGRKRTLAVYESDSGSESCWSIPLKLEPYEARMILIELGEATVESEQETASPAQIALETAGGWQLSAASGNIMRIGEFQLQFQTASGESGSWHVAAKTFVDQCSDLTEVASFPAVFKQTFGTPMQMSLGYPIACTYTAVFEVETVPASCDLFMDQNAISGEWTLYMNGHAVTSEQLVPMEVFDHRNIGCAIAAYLKPGKNELRVELNVRQDWDGIIDPLYLRGGFGVAFDPQGNIPVLTAAPLTTTGLQGGPVAGYPYYAGTLSFKRTIHLEQLPHTPEFELTFTDWDPHFHDCAEVLLNGQSLGVRPWTPYRWSGQTEGLRSGDNELEIRVTGTLIGLLDGDAFDYATHTLQTVQNKLKPLPNAER